MSSTNNNARLVDDLAGYWTNPALDILKASGFPAISVDTELETWQTVKNVLQSELRQNQPVQAQTSVSVDTVLAKVLHKALFALAGKLAPWVAPAEWASRIQPWLRRQHATAPERALYSKIAGQPATRASSRLPRRTDFFPRLEVLAIGG